MSSQECPSFLLPLPRAAGFEFYFCQFLDTRCGFTSLLEYKVRVPRANNHTHASQTHGENAPASLMMNFYTELKGSKGVAAAQLSGPHAGQGSC